MIKAILSLGSILLVMVNMLIACFTGATASLLFGSIWIALIVNIVVFVLCVSGGIMKFIKKRA